MRRRRIHLTARGRALSSLARATAVLGSVAALAAAVPFARSHRAVRTSADVAFGGRIIPADGGPLEGVHVVAFDSRGAYEAIMDSSGVFVGSFPASPSSRVTLRVFSDSTSQRYHTSVVTLGAGVPNEPVRILLLPKRWRIRGGTFDGREVPIDPVRATTRYNEGTGYWRVTRRGRFTGHAVSWVPDSFPVRVAFRHDRGDPFISPGDSIRFWDVARNLEAMLGLRLFRAASFEEIDAGADGIFVTVMPRMSAAGKTFVTYDASGRIYEALLTVGEREYLGQPRVATHELMHAIGLGHTGAWSSVMGPSGGGPDLPSVEDVAYAQVYFEISKVQRDREAQFGILESERE
mgnify:CR=1 FL=1|jgi:hypothetical protein